MQPDQIDALWMDSRSQVTLAELAALAALPNEILRELVDSGALVPINAAEVEWTRWTFSAHWVVTVRRARRLLDDFETETAVGHAALPLLLTLLERMRGLEDELCVARAQLPRLYR
jgi:hypothetical protein